MSILHRTAYLSLAALLTVVPAACGGDDDDDDTDDNNGGEADSGNGGGEADAGDEPDAGGGEPDAGGDEDAGTVEGQEYLLGVALPGTPLGDGVIRLIATVALSDDQATAEFSLQPIFSPNCPKQGEDGIPTGDPLTTEEPIAIEKGAFTLSFADVPIVEGTLGIDDGDTGCTLDIVITTLEVNGTVVDAGGQPGFCGTVSATTALGTIEGSFGSVLIKNGTQGADLPEALLDCE
jgi:hypothetical protein